MDGNPESIGTKINALDIWKVAEPFVFVVKPKGTVYPYFCSVMAGDIATVKVRLLMLEGWQTYHDYVRTRADRSYGCYSAPMEFPHFELVVLLNGEVRFFRHDTGYMPTDLNERERKLVARILWEAYGVFLRLETDPKLPFRYAKEKAMFSRVEVKSGVWEDRPLAITAPAPYSENINLVKEDLDRAKSYLPVRKGEVFGVDFRLLFGIMTKEPRPRCIYGLRVIDVKTGEPLAMDNVTANPSVGLRAMWEAVPPQVLAELNRIGRIPEELQTPSARMFRLLRSLCLELPFKLTLVDKMPGIDVHFRQKI